MSSERNHLCYVQKAMSVSIFFLTLRRKSTSSATANRLAAKTIHSISIYLFLINLASRDAVGFSSVQTL
jgi:hypothetical protein